MKEVNKYFSSIFFCVGALKVIIIFLALLTATTTITSIFNGRSVETTGTTNMITTIANILAYVQIALVPASIVMMILNRKTPQFIPGYLIGLGAFTSELLFSSIFLMWIAPVLYMRAGNYLNKRYENRSNSYNRYY